MENEKTVTISQKEYAQLLDNSRKLNALEHGGVDNWEWYGEAMSTYYDNDEDDDEEGEE